MAFMVISLRFKSSSMVIFLSVSISKLLCPKPIFLSFLAIANSLLSIENTGKSFPLTKASLNKFLNSSKEIPV